MAPLRACAEGFGTPCPQVLGVPDDMEYYGRGPLLSAKAHDLDVLWARARQMQAACEQARACRLTGVGF